MKRREPADVAAENHEVRDGGPGWADSGEDTDRPVGPLPDEGQRYHLPRELAWEYMAGRWSEKYGPADSASLGGVIRLVAGLSGSEDYRHDGATWTSGPASGDSPPECPRRWALKDQRHRTQRRNALGGSSISPQS